MPGLISIRHWAADGITCNGISGIDGEISRCKTRLPELALTGPAKMIYLDSLVMDLKVIPALATRYIPYCILLVASVGVIATGLKY
jgi:hypothetical protein